MAHEGHIRHLRLWQRCCSMLGMMSTTHTRKGNEMSTLKMIDYRTRDLGYGSEEGTVYGYITNEVDTWGKRTVNVLLANGDLEKWYLFADEYKETK